MKYLMTKAAELVGGLSEIKCVYFYTNTSGKNIQGYTKDLLIVDFTNNTRKFYKYSITYEQFVYIGRTVTFLPVRLSNWIVGRICQRY